MTNATTTTNKHRSANYSFSSGDIKCIKVAFALCALPFVCWAAVSIGQSAYQNVKERKELVVQGKKLNDAAIAASLEISFNTLTEGFKNRGVRVKEQTKNVAFIGVDPLFIEDVDGTKVLIRHVCGTQVHVVENYLTHLSKIVGYDDIYAYVPTRSLSMRYVKRCFNR